MPAKHIPAPGTFPKLLQVHLHPVWCAGKSYRNSHHYWGNFGGGSTQILLFLCKWQRAEIPVGSWWAVYIKARYAAATHLGEMLTVVGNYLCKIQIGSTVSVRSVRSIFSSLKKKKKKRVWSVLEGMGMGALCRARYSAECHHNPVPASPNTELFLYLLQNYYKA